SELGLGRHRASSMVFYYIKSPAGGQAEYSADSDYLTDDWKPRLWDAEYAQHHWVAAAPQGSGAASPAGVEIIEGPIPRLSDTVRRPAG
ncbi:MAG TPA: hypothetical protein VKS60_04545, partial [Stellaceae bacterium]|nr:hypothetical protein [Stellaceae bacterium]